MMAAMFDPVLLRSFLAVAQARNFTEAARRLGLQQSTVSQHVRRLEDVAGRRLFIRDTHRVTPTSDGEAMVAFARSILEVNERALAHFSGAQLRGRVRFGTSDDFVSSRLSDVLRDFTRRHPGVDLELTVDLSATLNATIQEGGLDVVLAKRRRGDEGGQLVWSDRLVWVCGAVPAADAAAPVPLILYAPPSLTRAMALEALERAGRPWRVVCTSSSLSGLRAAALAGLGVMLHARGLMPEGLVEAPAVWRLPAAGEIEFAVTCRRGARGAETALAEMILANADRLAPSPV
jgi:DNA-binding transcriptional LysR family regulator